MALIGISGKMQSGKNTVADIIQYLTHIKEQEQRMAYSTFLLLQYEQSAFTWKQKSFASKVKAVCSLLTGIPIEDFEKQEVKDRILGEEWRTIRSCNLDGSDLKILSYAEYENNPSQILNRDNLMKDLTVRQLLQIVGTDAMRDIVHPNIWVNALFSEYDYKFIFSGSLCSDKSLTLDKMLNETIKHSKKSNWIVTDVRFPNEAKAITDRGGFIIRVNRFSVRKEEVTNALTGTKDYFHVHSPISTHPSETSLDEYPFKYIVENNGTIEELIEKIKQILIKEKIL